jgi:hypothetical protein
MTKIKVNKAEFLFFIDSLSHLSDSAILHIKDGGISALGTNLDASLFLWNTMPVDCDSEEVLNIPSLMKLHSALKMCGNSDTLELILNKNNIEYRGSNIKFKYHLYEDGVIMKSKTSLTKLQSLKYDVEVKFTKQFLSAFLKSAYSFSKIKKLHLYTEDDHLIWSIQDKTIANSDVFSVVGQSVDFDLDQFIMNLDNVRLLVLPKDVDITLKMNIKLGIGKFELKYDNVNLNYIISTLIK